MDNEIDATRDPFIAVNTARTQSGHFATLFFWYRHPTFYVRGNKCGGDWYLVAEETSNCSDNFREANCDAAAWALELDLDFMPVDAPAVERAEREGASHLDRLARECQLCEFGVEETAAKARVRAEFGDPDRDKPAARSTRTRRPRSIRFGR